MIEPLPADLPIFGGVRLIDAIRQGWTDERNEWPSWWCPFPDGPLVTAWKVGYRSEGATWTS